MKWRYKIIVSVRSAEIVLAFFSVIHIASYFVKGGMWAYIFGEGGMYGVSLCV